MKTIYLVLPDGERILCSEKYLPLERPLESYFHEIPKNEKIEWWQKMQLREGLKPK